MDGCPFVNLPETRRSRWGLSLTKDEMENCYWLRPQLVPPGRVYRADA